MSLKIEMFSDFICPFCYIGFATIRKLKPEFDLQIAWRGFQIHPEWPAEGMPASEFRREMSPEVRNALWTRITAMGEAAGITMRPPALLTNSQAALEAAEFAAEKGLGEAFEERVYRAYFTEGLNIGQRGLIGELATEVGLDRGELDAALDSKRYAMRLKNHAMIAHNRNVDGVPTFFVGEYPLVGAQSEETMRHILQRYVSRLATTA
ncbi:MAG TPA: DsbA family oxidoreductase [Candidatus Binataceae bacterium]|jgi:predicted DsbA family dithiol-disulfide isomerase|nr:DsbA family oxidoreductase [Candidatus Binataceae bacterium]